MFWCTRDMAAQSMTMYTVHGAYVCATWSCKCNARRILNRHIIDAFRWNHSQKWDKKDTWNNIFRMQVLCTSYSERFRDLFIQNWAHDFSVVRYVSSFALTDMSRHDDKFKSCSPNNGSCAHMLRCLSLLAKHFKFYLHKHNFVHLASEFRPGPFIRCHIVANIRIAQSGRCPSCALVQHQHRCAKRREDRGTEMERGSVAEGIWWSIKLFGLCHYGFATNTYTSASIGPTQAASTTWASLYLLKNEMSINSMPWWSFLRNYVAQNEVRTRAYLHSSRAATYFEMAEEKIPKNQRRTKNEGKFACRRRPNGNSFRLQISRVHHTDFSIDFSPSSYPRLRDWNVDFFFALHLSPSAEIPHSTVCSRAPSANKNNFLSFHFWLRERLITI